VTDWPLILLGVATFLLGAGVMRWPETVVNRLIANGRGFGTRLSMRRWVIRIGAMFMVGSVAAIGNGLGLWGR